MSAPHFTILLVEDEVIIALFLKNELERAGYAVARWVTTGEAAVLAAEEIKTSVILMDIRLAGTIDGIEAAARIREHCAAPVIFMTGYQDSGIRQRAEAMHPLAFLNKPLGIEDLRPILEAMAPGA